MKAIYLTQEFDPKHPTKGAICLGYDEVEGFKLFVSGKSISIPANVTDTKQSEDIKILTDKIKDLEKTITVMKIDNAGGVIETDTSITVNVIDKNITSPEKDIVIYPVTLEKSTTIEGKSVTVDGATLNATPEQNASLIVKSSETIDLENVTVKGEFPASTNQIDVVASKKIVINDTNITATGYNGLMLVQNNFEVIPEEIIIENVNFEGDLSLATITICALADNAKVIIRNCKFGVSEAALRFRNSINAKNVDVLVENCHFDISFFEPGRCLVMLEENGNVLYEDGRTGSIWGRAKEIAGEAGIVLEKLPDGKMETGGSPTYVKRVFPYLLAYEDEQNRFGKDKMTITFRNCTYGTDNKKIMFTKDEYKNIIGTNNDNDLIVNIRQSGRASYNAWNENWPKDKNIFMPYDDEVKYIDEYIEEIEWTQTNKNSDSYPTIIFE